MDQADNHGVSFGIIPSQDSVQSPKSRTMASQTPESKPPFPPFTLETAQIKVKAAQDAWNTT